ncbi:MAG: DUF3857 domain-containing protein [Mucilaginibacter sp.]
MRSVFTLLLLLLSGAVSYAQQNYAVSLIPKELLPYASAVVRNEEVSTEVKGLDNTIYHVKTAITVLNKNGDDQARVVVFYNKSNIIRSIKGMIYDEFGKQIGKFSESDFLDQNAGQNFSLFEDIKVKHYLPAVTQYPYTIAYEYEVKMKQSLEFGDWRPNSSPIESIEKSTYTFICKPDFNIRYKEMNVPSKVVIGSNKDGSKTYTWEISNLKAFKPEPYSPDHSQYLTSVKIAPEKFEYEGIKGSFTNWQELGKWQYDKLLLNRQNLPIETITHIKEITDGITDPKLKAKKIYEYMQSKTHYISIQIGIGGYQPFLASDVDRLNYGDCKGLVNYTQALLKAVNIDSYYCVVEAGDHKVSMQPDFASMDQGDHIILCLPFKNDTTWLECTSQKIPFGYLGDFTDDRLVLACTPEGGKLMHTPKYDAAGNQEIRKANFVINNAGELSGEMSTTFKGLQYENREYLMDESPVEKNKIIQKVYPINNMAIKNLEIKQDKSLHPITTELIKLEASEYAANDNGKLYFAINSVNRYSNPPHEVRNRHNDVYINDGYTDEDEITYTIPTGYHDLKRPLSVSIEKPFGKFTASMTLKDGQIIYKRKLQVVDGTYSKDLYQDLVDFYQAVEEADHYTVTLAKND